MGKQDRLRDKRRSIEIYVRRGTTCIDWPLTGVIGGITRQWDLTFGTKLSETDVNILCLQRTQVKMLRVLEKHTFTSTAVYLAELPSFPRQYMTPHLCTFISHLCRSKWKPGQ